MDVFWTLPPVSRTITAAAVIVSALGYGGILPLMPLVFSSYRILRFPPEIWRMVTAFLITGPNLSIIFDPYFLYTYGSQLENGSAKFTRPGDFFTYLVFVATVIVATAGFYLQSMTFISPLIMAFIYTFAMDDPTRQVQFIILPMPAKYLPFAMLFLTFVMGGPIEALKQACGLLAAHLYAFLNFIWPQYGSGTGQPLIKTPAFVGRWFGADSPAPRVREYGTAFGARPVNEPNRGQASGFMAGAGGASRWNSRGAGHRLGGE